jgi:hypothetical protein
MNTDISGHLRYHILNTETGMAEDGKAIKNCRYPKTFQT